MWSTLPPPFTNASQRSILWSVWLFCRLWGDGVSPLLNRFRCFRSVPFPCGPLFAGYSQWGTLKLRPSVLIFVVKKLALLPNLGQNPREGQK